MLKTLLPLLGVCVFAAACGSSGSSSPAAPSSTSSGGSTTTTTPAAATTTTSSTVTSGVFTFNFGSGMLVSDQALIQSAITQAAAFYASSFGRSISQATTITVSATDSGCANGGASAFTGPRVMTICFNNNGWTVHDSLNKQKILMHETFHLLQFEQRWLGNPTSNTGATWLIEGSAEYMGWRSAANSGLIVFDTAKGCMVTQAQQRGASSSGPNLDSLESGQAFAASPPGYQLAMLGVDELVTSKNLASFFVYGDALAANTSFGTAFLNAWGQTTSAFYAQYPGYWSKLPGSSACGT